MTDATYEINLLKDILASYDLTPEELLHTMMNKEPRTNKKVGNAIFRVRGLSMFFYLDGSLDSGAKWTQIYFYCDH